MRCACVSIVVVAACGASTKPPSSTGSGPDDKTSGDRAAVKTSVESKQPARHTADALDGRLRIQPSSRCGGAVSAQNEQDPPLAPAPEIELEISAGTKYTGKPPLATITTGRNGYFSLDISPGTYCITIHGRGPRPRAMGPNYDLDCLVKTWERCDAIAEVPVKEIVAIDHKEPCAGLVCYHGPPPP